MWLSTHGVGTLEDLVQELSRELLRLQNVEQAGRDRHEKTSFPASQDRT